MLARGQDGLDGVVADVEAAGRHGLGIPADVSEWSSVDEAASRVEDELGLLFQFFAIAPMRGLGIREGIKAAAKADILSLSAFEVGLFGWMALMTFVFFPDPHLTPASPVYWFLMQIGMIIGFGTAWPANIWLIKHGIKEAM